MSLLQIANSVTTDLHNRCNTLKTEIELDRSRGNVSKRKEDQLEDMKTEEIKSHDYFAQATEETSKQCQTIIDSVPKDTDKTAEATKADETTKKDKTAKTDETTTKIDGTAKTDETTTKTDAQNDQTSVTGEVELNVGIPDLKPVITAPDDSSKTVSSQQIGKTVNITV